MSDQPEVPVQEEAPVQNEEPQLTLRQKLEKAAKERLQGIRHQLGDTSHWVRDWFPDIDAYIEHLETALEAAEGVITVPTSDAPSETADATPADTVTQSDTPVDAPATTTKKK